MDWLNKLIGKQDWSLWQFIGLAGTAIFASRFLVQWYATEKLKRVAVPVSFWWLSLAGSLTLLVYAVYKNKDLVVILAYAFAWIPYIRNLVIHYRHERQQQVCSQCGEVASPTAHYCAKCGAKLAAETARARVRV